MQAVGELRLEEDAPPRWWLQCRAYTSVSVRGVTRGEKMSAWKPNENLAQRFWSYASIAPSKWWFSALTACLGAVAGLLGSIHAEQIKNAFPFAWPGTTIVWPALGFWASLLVFGYFFGLGFRAQNEATNKLEQVIRTLPPRGFLVVFEDLFKACFGVDALARDEGQQGIEASITTALVSIATLAKSFDTRRDHPQYSINVMLFRSINEVDKEDIRKNVIFAEPGYNPEAWEGVLQLQKEFAFTLSDDGKSGIQKDTGVNPIMLPIPKPEFRVDRGKPTILPGAPAVYCDPSNFAGFENTLELAKWCRDQSGLRASIADDIERYFRDGPGKEIRSFISIPIVLPDGADPPGETIGVLNLHSNRERMLPGEKAALFAPLTTPFVLLIGRCLKDYRALSSESNIK
jgi:hypothetical protein